jgi:FdhE protein
VTLERWLATHRYLEPIARFEQLVEEAAAAIPAAAPPPPAWALLEPELRRGVPLLRTGVGRAAVAPAGAVLGALALRLEASPVAARLAARLRDAAGALGRSPERCERAVQWALDGARPEGAPDQADLVALLAWTAVRRVLGPTLDAFSRWLGDRWTLGACPGCGAQPAMAQLSGDGEIRHRRLACGCCGTRWSYRRVGCPHCPNEEAGRLGILDVAGDGAPLRIDFCESCRGYVKTYAGSGDEAVLLADWTTLHLDAAAQARGLRRVGAARYRP